MPCDTDIPCNFIPTPVTYCGRDVVVTIVYSRNYHYRNNKMPPAGIVPVMSETCHLLPPINCHVIKIREDR